MGVFIARNSAPITSWVLDKFARAHLLDGRGEQTGAVEDAGVLGEKAEDQPRHKMVHVVAARGGAPFGIVLQQLDIEPVQPACGPNVEGVFGDLRGGGDAGERQEKAEMVREVGIGAGDRPAARQVLGLEGVPVGCQNELGLGPGRRRAGPQRGEGLGDLAGGGDGDMDVVCLKDAAQVGPVRLALSQALEGRLLVAEGLEERERELPGVERLLGEPRYGLFNLNGVHTAPSYTIFSAAERSASSASTGSSTTSLQNPPASSSGSDFCPANVSDHELSCGVTN